MTTKTSLIILIVTLLLSLGTLAMADEKVLQDAEGMVNGKVIKGGPLDCGFGVAEKPAIAICRAAPEPKENLESKPQGPLKLTVSGIVSDKAGQFTAVVNIENTGQGSVFYSGYSKNSPITQKQILKDGEWKQEMLGFCGTGLKRIEFKAGEKSTFHVHLGKNEHTIKVGINYQTGNGKARLISWSPAFGGPQA